MHVNRKTGFPGFQKKLLCTAITLSLLPISGAVLAQDDEEVEEIVVTGSFIRRTEGFRSASPLTQLTLEDIAAEGTPNIGDIVHNLSFNQGSSISSNITPETADTSSAGITLEPIENLRIDLNYSKTDFRDRFVSVDPQQLLNLDFNNFKQATGFSGGLPSYAQLQAWNDSGSDPRIERNPTDLGQILRVVVGTSNASMMLVEAFDLQVSYQFDLGNAFSMIGLGDLDAGTMTINSNVTKIDKWEYQKFPTDPVSSPLGKRNRFIGEAPPLPELKGNVRLGWVMGNHSANLIGRYIDEVDFDGYNWKGITTFQYFTPFDPAIRDVLRASTVADAAYNYRGLELFGGSFDVTLGCRNCFDRMPQRVNDFAGMESILYDARGRLIYGRITMEF